MKQKKKKKKKVKKFLSFILTKVKMFFWEIFLNSVIQASKIPKALVA